MHLGAEGCAFQNAQRWLKWIRLGCTEGIGKNSVHLQVTAGDQAGKAGHPASPSRFLECQCRVDHRPHGKQQSSPRPQDTLIPNQSQHHRHLPRPEQRIQGLRPANTGALHGQTLPLKCRAVRQSRPSGDHSTPERTGRVRTAERKGGGWVRGWGGYQFSKCQVLGQISGMKLLKQGS